MLYALQGVPIKVTVAISGEETVLAGLDRAKDKFQADKEQLNENSIGHGVILFSSFTLFSPLFPSSFPSSFPLFVFLFLYFSSLFFFFCAL